MEPSEALSTAAQIAVALAGFAGVVLVFRRESVHEWSPLGKYRLRLLLMNSILPLAFGTVGLLLLTIKPVLPGIWRWVQRLHVGGCFALRDNDNPGFSWVRSAAVTKCAWYRIWFLSVWYPRNRRGSAAGLQHRNT